MGLASSCLPTPASQQSPSHADRSRRAAAWTLPPAMERRAAVAAAAQRGAFAKLSDWLRASGAVTSGVKIEFYSESVRGVHAARDIAPHKRIITIPHACLITDQMARETPLGQRIQKIATVLTAPKHCQLTCYILSMRERGDSFHRAFFDVLPTDIDSFPLLWDATALSSLEASSVVHEIDARRAAHRSDFDRIIAVAPEMERFGFDAFLWARVMVGSRNFSIVIGGKKCTAMVPLADMLNDAGHARDTAWTFDDSLDAFTVTSLHPIATGSQITDSCVTCILKSDELSLSHELTGWG